VLREAVPGPKPGGPYSPGIVAEGKFVFVSGQGPVRDGVYVQGTIEEETRLTLDNLLTVLAASGSGPEHVVRCGVWLTVLADFAGMNGVYGEVFPDPRPARATVQAQLIVGRVEVDCVAVVPSA
jgi:2-iminobutanoate/2-iminopropanoate deaminase